MDPNSRDPAISDSPNCDSDPSASEIYHLALDIGGSLAKLVYFTKDNNHIFDEERVPLKEDLAVSCAKRSNPALKGRLNFTKFETSKMGNCIEFIKSKKVHPGGTRLQDVPSTQMISIKATGGGAYKYAAHFKENLGITLDKEDEMHCLVTGANFLLKVVRQEAFIYRDGNKEYIQIDHNDLYPYLLVNIGSGVSMIKVDGDESFQRVSGTSAGGGTFWGLGKLLTKCKSFDELLELSHRGNNRVIDMLVGDIFGGSEYQKIGLSATAIASSFGKVISSSKELEDYKPEDIARSLLRMISNNIGQIAYLNALRFGLKRIFFGGFFIRGHSYTMDTISVAVNYWSKGEARAMFLHHDGFLGAMGAFLSYERHGLKELMANKVVPPLINGSPRETDSVNGKEMDGERSIACSVYAL